MLGRKMDQVAEESPEIGPHRHGFSAGEGSTRSPVVKGFFSFFC